MLNDLRRKAKQIRRNVLRMAHGKGEGYVGQGLGAADMLAALYFHEMRYDATKPGWPATDEARDRFLLSTGHYSIVLYAALTAIGLYPESELAGYGADESHFGMSTVADSPGVEITGGSLGMGLSQAVGMALGARLRAQDGILRHDQPAAFRVFNFLSDGELQEGATWEAAMCAAHYKLDNLVALVDVNGVQADGQTTDVMTMEPIEEKWRAFGWQTARIDGNSMEALVAALHAARELSGQPKVIVCDTVMGKGVPFIEARPRGHFVRVGQDEWDLALQQLEESDEQ
ncbi:MAG: transketolase [Blastocatellia bacterium]